MVDRTYPRRLVSRRLDPATAEPVIEQALHVRYSDGMPRRATKHVQLWMVQSLADAIGEYADDHGGLNFTTAITVLLDRAVRAEGYQPRGKNDQPVISELHTEPITLDRLRRD